MQLVNARDVKNVPGRPKTDKLDAVWLAKLTERGMLRPSFVPPAEIRQLRDYTRLRTDLTGDRARHWQRLEKLLEDALIKVSAVASTMDTLSVRDMLEALIAGERDPQVLAGLARGKMKAKRAALIEALTGKFDDHHAELARMLLDQIDALTAQIGALTTRIEELIAAIPAAQGVNADGTTGPGAAPARTQPGSSHHPLGRDPRHQRSRRPDRPRRDRPGHGRFPTAGHLVSWAKLCPRTIQSGAKQPLRQEPARATPTSKASSASRRRGRQDRHLPRRTLPPDRQAPRQTQGARRRRPLHPGHHLAPACRPRPRFHDLGPGYYASRIDTDRKTRNHIRQLEALGYTVTLAPAA